MASTGKRAGLCVSYGDGCDLRDQEPGARIESNRAMWWCSSAADRWVRGWRSLCQITSALKYLEFGKHVAVITDARFSGVSTGACIGHVSPEALAGGPIGKLRDGDVIEILVDRVNLKDPSTWWEMAIQLW
ncbi:MAG: dihydroxy-acid dehydratase [Bryobacteraceae bacterium]